MTAQDNLGSSCVPFEGGTRSSYRGSHLVLLILLPFVTGYFLSYYFRTVNAVLSERLGLAMDLNAGELGLITSAYFLMAAVAQLPIGVALDRFGPKRVQVACLLLASMGAMLFAFADDLPTLFLARALIGLGVASALMAGLKALAVCCPPNEIGFYNGVFICVGATGALIASEPTEFALSFIDWRLLFLLLAIATAASSIFIGLVVPSTLKIEGACSSDTRTMGLIAIYKDPGFWRLAPLSALAIGGAWALLGLWSAPWLRDVASLDQDVISQHLFGMAVALCLGALGFGILLGTLTKIGVGPRTVMAIAALVFILAEAGLALGIPVPPFVLWAIIGTFGAGTVLSYAITADRYSKHVIARANCALNLLHFGAAFSVQAGFGHVISLWPKDEIGRYPAEAYSVALLALVSVQFIALIWFLRPISSAQPVASGRIATVENS